VCVSERERERVCVRARMRHRQTACNVDYFNVVLFKNKEAQA